MTLLSCLRCGVALRTPIQGPSPTHCGACNRHRHREAVWRSMLKKKAERKIARIAEAKKTPPQAGYSAPAAIEARKEKRGGRPRRRKSDPSIRCFWCSHWRCNKWMQICGECEATYQERLATLPAFQPKRAKETIQ